MPLAEQALVAVLPCPAGAGPRLSAAASCVVRLSVEPVHAAALRGAFVALQPTRRVLFQVTSGWAWRRCTTLSKRGGTIS